MTVPRHGGSQRTPRAPYNRYLWVWLQLGVLVIPRELTFARVRTTLFLPFGQLAQVVQSDHGLVTSLS